MHVDRDRTMKHRTFVVVLLYLLGGTEVLSGEENNNTQRSWTSLRSVRVGILGAGGVTIHGADFSSLPELPTCCPRFRDGSGLTTTGMLWGEYPVWKSLVLGVRMGVAQFAGILRALERKPVLVDDTPTEAVIQHSLDAQFRAIRWESYVGVRASPLVDLSIGVGTDLIQQATATTKEELVQPNIGTFENGRRIRNERTSELESSTRSMVSLLASVRFSIPLGRSQQWWFVPELSFRYALDPLMRQQQWYVYSVLVGAGIAYAPVTLQSFHKPEPEPVRTEPALPALAASIVAYGVGSTQEPVPLRIEEHLRQRVFPLLPVLYMNGMELPERYVLPESSDDTSWYRLLSSPLGAYYALVPIVATRLRERGDTLKLVGIDAQSATAARRRAEYIARYLQAIWKIPARQLRVQGRIDERDTTARVILEGNEQLFAPVEYTDTARTVTPPILRVRPATNGAELLRQWMVRVVQDSLEIARYAGNGGLPLRLDVDLSSSLERLHTDAPLRIELDVESVGGSRADAAELVPLTMNRLDRAFREVTAERELYYFPTRLPHRDSITTFIERYRNRLRDYAIVAYGNSLDIEEALSNLQRYMSNGGLPNPRIERRDSLYRAYTPERVWYSQLVAVTLRYALPESSGQR